MTGIKIGGVVLTGIGAWILINKTLNVVRGISSDVKTASMWNSYYKCWYKNRGQNNNAGSPIAPGYSVTKRPVGRDDVEIVKNPSGKDHSQDNDKKQEQSTFADVVKDVVIDAVKAGFGVSIKDPSNSTQEGVETQEGASTCDSDDILKERITEYDENGKPIAGVYPFDVDIHEDEGEDK